MISVTKYCSVNEIKKNQLSREASQEGLCSLELVI
jgi:hypothetical protein